MTEPKSANYLANHWYGRHSFAWSFWVNLVGLRALILLGQDWASPAEDADFSNQTIWVLGLALFFHGIVFIWQVVGVLRASEGHMRAMGSMANVWGAQLGILAAFWITATYALGAWQMTLPAPVEIDPRAQMELDRAKNYTLTVSDDGMALALTGSIELGVSKKFAALVLANPNLTTIILTSPGGNIYEARGLSKLIRDNALNTAVNGDCTSACTTVFIGGKQRLLQSGARLGFHQYRIDATYKILNADPAAEQERDRKLYASGGVKLWFLDKMFNSIAAEMWFPQEDELLQAGVVTELAN